MAILEVNWNPSRREVRQFAAIWFPLLCVVLACVLWRGSGSWIWAVIPLATGLVIAPLAYIFPKVGKWLFVGCIIVTYPIGWVVSHILMGMIFYLLITPMGLLMRLGGRDAMGRKFRPEQKSYWIPHQTPKSSNQYFRQY